MHAHLSNKTGYCVDLNFWQCGVMRVIPSEAVLQAEGGISRALPRDFGPPREIPVRLSLARLGFAQGRLSPRW